MVDMHCHILWNEDVMGQNLSWLSVIEVKINDKITFLDNYYSVDDTYLLLFSTARNNFQRAKYEYIKTYY